jgi:hypothetical protein
MPPARARSPDGLTSLGWRAPLRPGVDAAGARCCADAVDHVFLAGGRAPLR